MNIKLILSGVILVAAATPVWAATPPRNACHVASHCQSRCNCVSHRKSRHGHARTHSRQTVQYQNPAWYYEDRRRMESAPVYADSNPPPPPPVRDSMADYPPPYPPPASGGPTYNFFGPTQNFFGPTNNYFGAPDWSQGASAPAPAGRDDDRLDPWRHYDHRDGTRNGY